MRRLERAVLVEGYFDCIALDNAGVDGVVASMGTSLTTGQAAMIRRLARRVIVAYDGDEAGRGATLRAAPILLSAGLDVGVVDVGPGEDPDTFLRNKGLDAVIELLARAVDVFDFALGRLAPNPSAMRGAEKSEAVEALVPLIAAVADPVMRNDAAQRVADRMGLEFSSVWSRVRTGGGGFTARTPSVTDLDGVVSGEKEVLRCVLLGLDPEISIKTVRAEFFQETACRQIFERLVELEWTPGGAVQSVVHTLRSEEAVSVLAAISFEPDSDPDRDRQRREGTRALLAGFRRREVEERLRANFAATKAAESAGNPSETDRLLSEKQQLLRELRDLTNGTA
jgi:DNA primase